MEVRTFGMLSLFLGCGRDDDVGEDKDELSRKEGFDRWIPLAFTMRWE